MFPADEISIAAVFYDYINANGVPGQDENLIAVEING
jgi:hypothetical protein